MDTRRPRALHRAIAAASIAAAILLPLACSEDRSSNEQARSDASGSDDSTIEPVVDPGDGGAYERTLDPADFVDVVDNPYMPLAVGSTWTYEGDDDDGEAETVVVEVLEERRDIGGISATVVRDTVTVAGELAEATYDWFAQDTEGNVWYLGEDVRDFENGEVVSTDGSFEAGVGAAQPGIVMLADPQVGDAYRQEFDPGNAEDMAEVLEVGASRTVTAGPYEDVLVTEDWNPLEPDTIENKHYAPGVGLVFEEKVAGGEGSIQLVEFNPGT